MAQPKSKTQSAIEAYRSGDLKKALLIVKSFRIGLSAEQRGALSLGYECIVHPDFYRSLNRDVEQSIARARELFVSIFLKG